MRTCRYTSNDQPRTLYDQHLPSCPSTQPAATTNCEGCLPCPHTHCPICHTAHHDGTCPSCVGHTRDEQSEATR